LTTCRKSHITTANSHSNTLKQARKRRPVKHNIQHSGQPAPTHTHATRTQSGAHARHTHTRRTAAHTHGTHTQGGAHAHRAAHTHYGASQAVHAAYLRHDLGALVAAALLHVREALVVPRPLGAPVLRLGQVLFPRARHGQLARGQPLLVRDG